MGVRGVCRSVGSARELCFEYFAQKRSVATALYVQMNRCMMYRHHTVWSVQRQTQLRERRQKNATIPRRTSTPITTTTESRGWPSQIHRRGSIHLQRDLFTVFERLRQLETQLVPLDHVEALLVARRATVPRHHTAAH